MDIIFGNMNLWKKATLFYIGIYAIFRIIFLPTEFTLDSYGYACEILKHDLLSPHHLFFKYVYNAFFELLRFTQIEPIRLFSIITLFFSTLTLLIIIKILELLLQKEQNVFVGIVFISTTFSFLRYSQEFEAYILPIFISCIGTYYYLKGNRIIAAVALGIACLFHQIHIFWLVGMFLMDVIKKPRNSIYLLLALSIPALTYIVYAYVHSISLSHLVFHDVDQGLVQVYPNLHNLLFTMINAVRSVIFANGESLVFLKEWDFKIWTILIITLLLLIIGTTMWLKSGIKRFQFTAQNKPLILVLVLQFLFAAYSVGNIEFMVMIPVILMFLMPKGLNFKGFALIVMGISLWNISQFIIPQNKKKGPFLSTAHTFIEANSLNQKDLIITPEPDYLINYLEYHQLINSEKQSIANIVGDNSNLDSLLTMHSYNSVYIIKPKKQMLNRFSITHNAQLKFTLKDRYSIDTVEHYALEVIKIRQIITNSND